MSFLRHATRSKESLYNVAISEYNFCSKYGRVSRVTVLDTDPGDAADPNADAITVMVVSR
jgi:hypothetical protein